MITKKSIHYNPKFKAWDIINKVMIPDVNVYPNDHIGFSVSHAKKVYGDKYGDTELLGDGDTVWLLDGYELQETIGGCFDKNGKEVYRNDILKDSDGRYWLVLFGPNTQDNSIASYTMQPTHSKSIYPIDKSINKFEVVGSRYEFPELLKKKRK